MKKLKLNKIKISSLNEIKGGTIGVGAAHQDRVSEMCYTFSCDCPDYTNNNTIVDAAKADVGRV